MSCSAVIRSLMAIGLSMAVMTAELATAQLPPSFLGRSSCASATCHGGSIDRGTDWNHSLSTWSLKDPHAGAALLLRGELSKNIVNILDPSSKDSPERYDNVLRTASVVMQQPLRLIAKNVVRLTIDSWPKAFRVRHAMDRRRNGSTYTCVSTGLDPNVSSLAQRCEIPSPLLAELKRAFVAISAHEVPMVLFVT
jgi:hypothetical protein